MSDKNFLQNEISNIFEKIQSKNPNLLETMRIQKAWYSSVETDIAHHTQAVFVVPNKKCSEVIVYVDNPIWTTELNMRAEVLRMNLNVALKKLDDSPVMQDESVMFNFEDIEIVKKLQFKTSKNGYKKQTVPQDNTYKFFQSEGKEKLQPIPLNGNEEQIIQEQLKDIENVELKESIYQAIKSQVEWEKAKHLNEQHD